MTSSKKPTKRLKTMITTSVIPTYLGAYTNTMSGFASQSKDFILESTGSTPFIRYNRAQKKLVLNGKSTGENVADLYKPVITMLKQDTVASKTVTVDIQLSDINTKTTGVLFDLFKYLGLKKLTGGNVEVIWRVDATNADMIDTGLNFSDLYDLDAKIIMK